MKSVEALPSAPASSEADSLPVSTTLVCRYTIMGSVFSILTPPVRHQQLSFNMESIPRGLLSDWPLLFSVVVSLTLFGVNSLEFLPAWFLCMTQSTYASLFAWTERGNGDFTVGGPEQHHCRSGQPVATSGTTAGLMPLDSELKPHPLHSKTGYRPSGLLWQRPDEAPQAVATHGKHSISPAAHNCR